MLILCFKIFLSRILDVSLSSVRTMFVVKCNKIMASLIAFVEIFIWFYAAKEALVSNSTSLCIIVSYALGYATGTFIGTLINEKFISGIYSLKVSLKGVNEKMIKKLNSICLDVVSLKGEGKNILFLEVDKKNYKELVNNIYIIDKSASIVINDAKFIRGEK
ncbi:hypothetical protein EGP95_05670 [bacterium]|nr:hypothetical protein [bacterium]